MTTTELLWKVPCAGVPIAACQPRDALNEVVRLATRAGSGADVHLCNAYTLAHADADYAYKQMLRAATLNLPDGTSVVWANRLRFGHRVSARRVYGPDLFLDVLGCNATKGLRHYLLGGSPEVLADLEGEIRRRFPAARLVGAESPPFRTMTAAERQAQRARLLGSGANVVWVGLGTPRQDWVCAELAAVVPAVFVAVGAAFDFIAGAKRQAPILMQRSGLEWIFRLATEPRRLWKRYLFGNLRFLQAALLGWVRD